MTYQIEFKKQSPEYLGQFFNDENEASKNLKWYFFMENGEIEKMDSCKKFTYAMANNLQMYSRVIGYVAPDEKCSVFQFEEVSAQYVAKALTNETEEIFLSMDPANSALVSSMNEFSDFTKAVSKKLKFIKFQK